MDVALEQLDQYALFDDTTDQISDLLHFRNITKRDLRKVGSLHKIQPIAKLQAYLFAQYLILLEGQKEATLVFIGSGDAVLEIYVALHALENFANMGHRFRKFRVILSDVHELQPQRKMFVEFIFSLAQSAFPELQWTENNDIVNVFPQLSETDNYSNTVFLAMNLSMPGYVPRGTQRIVDPKEQFVEKLLLFPRFKNARFISCSSIGPSKEMGIWVSANVLGNFASSNAAAATNIEKDPTLQSCIQCKSEIHGTVWRELNNPQRIFCGKQCQKDFWNFTSSQ